ncbi:hypothetical protein L2E82_10845 [Cichorium intybus]|uniref:Uncharacterized protein n=1 Tax=Cichorium intybus TaxID=13427 RepID=A0ACB9GDP6_CICIN|nr:hypothetical protein L2E82_10845 [Cichorium intybus]
MKVFFFVMALVLGVNDGNRLRLYKCDLAGDFFIKSQQVLGAVLPHGNMIGNVAGGSLEIKFYPSDVYISYLPLAHIYERSNQKSGVYIEERNFKISTMKILKTNFFHVDPHPGNLAIDSDESLIYYDFGTMGEIKSFTREILMDIFYAVYEKDAKKIMNSLINLEELQTTGDMSWVFLFQKAALYKCNIAGNQAAVTRLVDTMTDNLRATRAEATDVGNAVLDG